MLVPEFIRKNTLNHDLTEFPAVACLSLLFLLSRIPFMNLGFSAFIEPTDQDVLAVVNSAYLLLHEQVYSVSRFPGYPFYEIFNSLIIGGGWIATNAATMVFSFISIIIFARILNIFEIKNKAMLVLTLAFMPIIWVNSVITMDYMWALMFVLLGSYLLFSGKYSTAGVAIGFAVGTRFTSGLMLIPIVLWAVSEKVRFKKIFTLIFTSFAVSALLFSPVAYKYGFDFFRGSGFLSTTPFRSSYSMAVGSIVTALDNAVMEFGVASIAALIFFSVLVFKGKMSRGSEHRHLLNFSLCTLLVYILLYFIFPYKVAYLIPAVPWGLIALNEKFPDKFTIIVCSLLLLNGIVSVDITNDENVQLKIDYGIVLKNYEDRKSTGIEVSEEYMESLSNLLSEK